MWFIVLFFVGLFAAVIINLIYNNNKKKKEEEYNKRKAIEDMRYKTSINRLVGSITLKKIFLEEVNFEEIYGNNYKVRELLKKAVEKAYEFGAISDDSRYNNLKYVFTTGWKRKGIVVELPETTLYNSEKKFIALTYNYEESLKEVIMAGTPAYNGGLTLSSASSLYRDYGEYTRVKINTLSDFLEAIGHEIVILKQEYNENKKDEEFFVALIKDAYNDICSSIEEVDFNLDVRNESIPFIITVIDLVAMKSGKNRNKLVGLVIPLMEQLCRIINFDEYVEERMQQYATIIRRKECRAEWLEYDYDGDELVILKIAFGDMLFNPSCRVDYYNSPAIIKDITYTLSFCEQLMNAFKQIDKIVAFIKNYKE